jgi:hypothetical protein
MKNKSLYQILECSSGLQVEPIGLQTNPTMKDGTAEVSRKDLGS